MSDLTSTETANVLRAMKFLHARLGTWDSVAAALQMDFDAFTRVRRTRIVTERLTFRVARVLGVGIDAVLAGDYAPAGLCPHCAGKLPE
jgi:hypothetical protein